MSLAISSPGFFGKVTTHGDFVSRRLPEDFLHAWDNWLQQSMQQSRCQLDQAWLGVYLTSPIWRFALGSGVCGGNRWVGIMMPSIDRVGRHFPLTIAAALHGDDPIEDWLADGQTWYDELEALALSSLVHDFVLADFDKALLGMPALPGPPMVAGASLLRHQADGQLLRGVCVPIAGLMQVQAAMPAIDMSPAGPTRSGQSLWWTDGSQQIAPCLLACQGLPAASTFSAMLDGQWEQWGWNLRAAGTQR